MAFDIDQLKSNIESQGYIKNNAFEVLITPPQILQNRAINNLGTSTPTKEIVDNLRFRIEQVRAPGIALISSDVNRYGVGPTQKVPVTAQFQETTFSILCDGFGDIWQFWNNWIRGIFEFNGIDSARVGNASQFASYLNDYKSRYSTTMEIFVYDMFGNLINRINLYEAFPTSLREVNLAWNDTQNLMRLSVSIAYTEYTLSGSTLESTITNQRPSIRFSATRGNTTTIG
jgi:hypothetical protein